MKITLHRDGFDLTKLKFSLNSEHSSDKPYLWNLNLIWSKTTLDLKPHWWRWFELTSHQTSWEVLHIHGTRKFFFFTNGWNTKAQTTRFCSVYCEWCKPLTFTLHCGIWEVKKGCLTPNACVYLTLGFYEACVSSKTPIISWLSSTTISI